MDNLLFIERQPQHEHLWSIYEPIISKKIFGQSLLFIGTAHAQMRLFALRFIALNFCQKNTEHPCGKCTDCQLIAQSIHPDILYIQPEATSSGIKIEQIRALQDWAFQSPTRQTQRFVILNLLEDLSLAGANALLKILEEPPQSVVFILITERRSILPTILSRCQRLMFDTPESFYHLNEHYLSLGMHYPSDACRHQLMQEELKMTSTMMDLLEQRLDICSAAKLWENYHIKDMLWFLYLFTANYISMYKLNRFNPLLERLNARFVQPLHLYAQLDCIEKLIKQTNQNIALNGLLVLEAIFLGYSEANDVFRK